MENTDPVQNEVADKIIGTFSGRGVVLFNAVTGLNYGVQAAVPNTPAVIQPTESVPQKQNRPNVSRKKGEVFDTPLSKSTASNFEILYVPRFVQEEAYKNDKDNNPAIGGAGQSINRIIERGGYSIEELDKLSPTWRNWNNASEQLATKPAFTLKRTSNPVASDTSNDVPWEQSAPSRDGWSRIYLMSPGRK
jgi:hypothetical protein